MKRAAVFPITLALAGALGCSVHVASLKVAAPAPVPADRLASLRSRGRQEGKSCRIWLLGIPFGMPQVDEAISNALAPVDGILMRDVTVFSIHPIYGLLGWHCYGVRGEAFG